MRRREAIARGLLCSVAVAMTACGTQAPPVPSEEVANPASVYCEQQGGEVVITTDDQGGQGGTCRFPDGSQCEEWAYYRGECTPGESPS